MPVVVFTINFLPAMLVYHFLDWFLIIFHCAVILFNLFGWIWAKTRRWNLAVLVITAISWLVPGMWYGIGYCFLTDWHWQIRWKLGYHDMPHSFVKFILDTVTGMDWNALLVDIITGSSFVLAIIVSISVNFWPYLKRRRISSRQ